MRTSRHPQHFIAGGQGALPQDSNGRPWTGDNVFSSGDLVEDLTHNFFLETGARNNKLKVYYRFSIDDYKELPAVFNGPNPETGEELEVFEEASEGVPPRDLPPQPAVFAPDYAPEEIAEIAAKLRQEAGLPKEPTGLVADLKQATKRATRKAASKATSR
jgi:Mn-containing catalase